MVTSIKIKTYNKESDPNDTLEDSEADFFSLFNGGDF